MEISGASAEKETIAGLECEDERRDEMRWGRDLARWHQERRIWSSSWKRGNKRRRMGAHRKKRTIDLYAAPSRIQPCVFSITSRYSRQSSSRAKANRILRSKITESCLTWLLSCDGGRRQAISPHDLWFSFHMMLFTSPYNNQAQIPSWFKTGKLGCPVSQAAVTRAAIIIIRTATCLYLKQPAVRIKWQLLDTQQDVIRVRISPQMDTPSNARSKQAPVKK